MGMTKLRRSLLSELLLGQDLLQAGLTFISDCIKTPGDRELEFKWRRFPQRKILGLLHILSLRTQSGFNLNKNKVKAQV